jgi:hypothetical protein
MVGWTTEGTSMDIFALIPSIMTTPLEPTPWMVENWLVRGHYTLISGTSGWMKSTLALWLAKRALLEDPEQRVIYIDLENSDNLVRQRCDLLKIPPEMGERLCYWNDGARIEQDSMRPPTVVFDPKFSAAQEDYPEALYIFDSLNRFLGARDENRSSDMASVSRFFRDVCRKGGTVLVIHQDSKAHEGYDNAIRGSSEIRAATDIAVQIDDFTPGENPFLSLRYPKNRFSPLGTFNLLFDSSIGDYVPVENREAAKKLDRQIQIYKVLLEFEDGISMADLVESLKGQLSREHIRNLLAGPGHGWEYEQETQHIKLVESG